MCWLPTWEIAIWAARPCSSLKPQMANIIRTQELCSYDCISFSSLFWKVSICLNGYMIVVRQLESFLSAIQPKLNTLFQIGEHLELLLPRAKYGQSSSGISYGLECLV